jgi:hypothetical protein
MIISAKIIKNPRKIRDCASCNKAILGEQLRLYGAAHTCDQPYVLYVHPNCIENDKEIQIKLKVVRQ